MDTAFDLLVDKEVYHAATPAEKFAARAGRPDSAFDARRKRLAEFVDLGAHHKGAIALIRIVLEIILMVGLGRPVIGQRQHLGHDGFSKSLS